MVKGTVAVIGAGLGGVSAAISLAAAGFEVDVFEKNERIGGKLNTLSAGRFRFDLGPSILLMPGIFRALFRRAGANLDDYLRLQEIRPQWRNFFEDGTVIDLTPDTVDMERELEKLGDRQNGFYAFLEHSREQYRLIEKGYFRRGYDTLSELVRGYGPLSSLFEADAWRTMDHSVSAFIPGEKLVDIMNYFMKYVGSSPYDAPAVLSLLPYAQLGHGLWYAPGGMYRLAEALERLLGELDVRVHLNREVTGITARNGRVAGIVLDDGAAQPCDFVVSNMEVIPAYEQLLHEGRRFLQRYDRFEPSCSGFVLHLGVDKKFPRLRHHNFFYSRDARRNFNEIFHEYVLPSDPTIYVVASSVSDPTQAPPGCENIKILPHVPHIRPQQPLTRADYLAFREVVLDKLERMGLAGLRRHIVVEDLWIPEDIERRYYSNCGSIYGVVSDWSINRGLKAPKQSEKYANLYFVGGSVNPGAGMPMVCLSGQLVCDRIVAAARTKEAVHA